MPSRPLAKVVPVLDGFVKLPQFAILQVEVLVGIQQAWMRQCIADWREVVAPDARSLLALKEGRIHKEMAADN